MYRPKVGEECLVCIRRSHRDGYVSDSFIKSKIDLISEVGVVYSFNGGVQNFVDFSDYDIEFRPLKSKQDTEIEEIESILNSGGGWVEPALRLYNSGYRKQMPYGEFVSEIATFIAHRFDSQTSDSFVSARQLAERLNRTPEETL